MTHAHETQSEIDAMRRDAEAAGYRVETREHGRNWSAKLSRRQFYGHGSTEADAIEAAMEDAGVYVRKEQ